VNVNEITTQEKTNFGEDDYTSTTPSMSEIKQSSGDTNKRLLINRK